LKGKLGRKFSPKRMNTSRVCGERQRLEVLLERKITRGDRRPHIWKRGRGNLIPIGDNVFER